MSDDDLDFTAAMEAPAPNDEPDFQATMTPKKRGRKPKPPSNNNIYIYKGDNIDDSNNTIIMCNIKDLKNIDMKGKLTAQELTFLEIFFNSPHGKKENRVTIDKCMISAGYGNMAQSSRYFIAKKILEKYEATAPQARQVFSRLGFGPVRVAQGIIDKAQNAPSDIVSLRALDLAARCQGMTEQAAGGGGGVNIIINTGPPQAPGPGLPGAPGAPVVIVSEEKPAALPVKPLQITR